VQRFSRGGTAGIRPPNGCGTSLYLGNSEEPNPASFPESSLHGLPQRPHASSWHCQGSAKAALPQPSHWPQRYPAAVTVLWIRLKMLMHPLQPLFNASREIPHLPCPSTPYWKETSHNPTLRILKIHTLRPPRHFWSVPTVCARLKGWSALLPLAHPGESLQPSPVMISKTVWMYQSNFRFSPHTHSSIYTFLHFSKSALVILKVRGKPAFLVPVRLCAWKRKEKEQAHRGCQVTCPSTDI